MLKRWKTFQVFLQRFVPSESLEGCVKKPPSLLHCRCLYVSSSLGKKTKDQNALSLRLQSKSKRDEAPFFYKVIRREGNLPTTLESNLPTTLESNLPTIFEPAFVYQPTAVILKDDISPYGKHFYGKKFRVVSKENVLIIQPRFRWGENKTKLAEHRLEEAKGLIDTVSAWGIHTSCIESIQDEDREFFFGTGKVIQLTERISDAGITMVFINTSRLSGLQTEELTRAWGCKVFDRYRVVLEIFKERAHSGIAKLQVRLAEIQYLRNHRYTGLETGLLHDRDFIYVAQKIGRNGETPRERTKRILDSVEVKVKKKLKRVKTAVVRSITDRSKENVPQVAIVGYTNAGKTELAKVLAGSTSGLEAENRLFATLDSTAHQGRLPSGLNMIVIDTVGFISELPHELVESFSATLEEVKHADLLIHITDVSHPEYALQKETVEKLLKSLNISDKLMKSKIIVLNKIDRLNRQGSNFHQQQQQLDQDAIAISVTEGLGLEKLKVVIARKLMESTGRVYFTINLDLQVQSMELSWLHRNATVIDTIPHDNESLMEVVAILDVANKSKFEHKFQSKVRVL